MKIKILLALLALIVSPAYAWNKIDKNLYAIYGTRITQTTDMLQPYAEIVYNSAYDTFGIAFMDSNGNRESIKYGIFNMRSCGVNTTGAIVQNNILGRSGSSDQVQNIFLACKRPMFFRIWDTNNNYVTYKFENVGTLSKD